MSKPAHPLPLPVRRVLKRALPDRIYRRHVGRHEDESLALWRTLAARVGDGAILDIGAYHGEFSLAARGVNGAAAIYAFEPNPTSLAVLRREMESARVEVVPVALSDAEGVLPFALASTQSRLLTAGETVAGAVEVPTRPLDDWAREAGVVPRLVKIDVEGAEAAVLRGARETLSTHRPIVLVEILSDGAGERAESEIPMGYHRYRIDENRGVEERAVLGRDRWRDKNWLLVPDERLGEIAKARRV